LVAELTVELQALLTGVDERFAHELVAVAKGLALPGDLSPVTDPRPLTTTGTSEVRDELTPQRLAAAAAESGRKGVQRWLYGLLAAVGSDADDEIARETWVFRTVLLHDGRRYVNESLAQLKELNATAENAARMSAAERARAVAELDATRRLVDSAMEGLDRQQSRYPGCRRDFMDANFVWQRRSAFYLGQVRDYDLDDTVWES
jgi:hypothetical protein